MEWMSGLYHLGQMLHIVDPQTSYVDYQMQQARDQWSSRDEAERIAKLKKKFKQNASQLHVLQYACYIDMDSHECDGYVAGYRRVVDNVQNRWEDTLETLRDNGLTVSFHLTKENDQCDLLVTAQDIYTGAFVYPKKFLGQYQYECLSEDYYRLR